MKLLVATTNPHKLREFSEILAPHGVEVVGLDSTSHSEEVEPNEDGLTFEANARIKAGSYARALSAPCLADDSGLEVDALGGAPGVRSARYAGSHGSRTERDKRNRDKLRAELERLAPVDRRARLVCVLCLADSAGNVLFETRGTWEGQILDEPRGEGGFGYDTLLLLDDGRTAAELDPEQRNLRSHRAAATRALLAWIEGFSLSAGLIP